MLLIYMLLQYMANNLGNAFMEKTPLEVSVSICPAQSLSKVLLAPPRCSQLRTYPPHDNQGHFAHTAASMYFHSIEILSPPV